MATRKGKKVIKVNFTGVSTEGGGRLLPEEEFLFEVEDVEQEIGESSGEPYLKITFKVTEGEFEGTKAWDNMSLQAQALWKLRGFMEAAGLETTDGPMEIDPDDFIGVIVKGQIIHEDYKGKPKHRIDSYSPAEDSEPAAEPEEKTTSRKKKAAEPEDDAVEFKKGQKVTFKDGKKKLTGTVQKIDGDKVDVLVKGVSKEADGEYEMDAADLEAA